MALKPDRRPQDPKSLAYFTAPTGAWLFKSNDLENWFPYYLTGLIAISLIVYVTMRDTKKHSALHRHE
jgi:MFS transporter, MHS family, alpha-ketoglutarate permease